jgi:hypothetical protein
MHLTPPHLGCTSPHLASPHFPSQAFRSLQAFAQAQLKVPKIVAAVGAGVFHGFLPEQLRLCVSALQQLVTSRGTPLPPHVTAYLLTKLPHRTVYYPPMFGEF